MGCKLRPEAIPNIILKKEPIITAKHNTFSGHIEKCLAEYLRTLPYQ